MLEGDGGQLGRPAAQGLQGHVDPRQQHTALVIPALGDDADGGGGAHVDGDDRRLEFLQRRHRVGHDVRPYLGLDRQPDVQPRPHTGPHHHGRLAQQPGQSLLHHEVQGGDHAAQDRPRHILKPEVIQGEQVHQVDADLVCGLAAVRVQGCQKPQLLVPVKQPHRGVGVSYINGQQHKPLSFFLPILIVFYGITPCRRMQGRDRGKIFR